MSLGVYYKQSRDYVMFTITVFCRLVQGIVIQGQRSQFHISDHMQNANVTHVTPSQASSSF